MSETFEGTVPDAPAIERPKHKYARWRALSLSLVYIVFAIHVVHWKISGKTLAPLELNEVMYTLELGIITAGFLFMCFLVLGTLVFGRFFCSWACHIMVLQDLCAWLLRKVGIRAKPIRSRLLLLVPPLTAFYMFVWPQIVRAWREQAFPTFHLATDAQGWASFATTNFWRNLPSAGVIVLTFMVCGFAIVYLMGSRTFCTYVCPYGAIFSLADRFSPGRIVVSDACRQCGRCTANCTSGVRVHEEVKMHGMIVNPACLKDLDCLGGCPQKALSYTFTRPALFKSFKSGGRFGLPYDFSILEELLIAMVFVVVLLSFRGLYSRIPFLLSLALGGIIGFVSVLAVRLLTRPNVNLSTIKLKTLGRITAGGRAFTVCTFLLAGFVGHSAFVRYHEYNGLRQASGLHAGGGADMSAQAEAALQHLRVADRWGLMSNERVERRMLVAAGILRDFVTIAAFAGRLLDRYPYDPDLGLQLGSALAEMGRKAAAEREYRAIIAHWGGSTEADRDRGGSVRPPALVSAHHALAELLAERGEFEAGASELRMAISYDPGRAGLHAGLGGILAELGQIDAAVESLHTALALDGGLGSVCYNLGTLLAFKGRFAEAVEYYERAIAAGTEDAEVHNNLGFAVLRMDRVDEAAEHFKRAVELDPNSADAHFNLGTLLGSREQYAEADKHLQLAAQLDDRYARLLGKRHHP